MSKNIFEQGISVEKLKVNIFQQIFKSLKSLSDMLEINPKCYALICGHLCRGYVVFAFPFVHLFLRLHIHVRGIYHQVFHRVV